MSHQALLTQVAQLAQATGEKILSLYGEHNLTIKTKADASLVTNADLLSHHAILDALTALTPDIPTLSEEADLPPLSVRQNWEQCWLVDPLDGTREFIEGTGEFTINIALIKANRPVLGVIYVPVERTCYCAAEGVGAYMITYDQVRLPLEVRKQAPERMLVLTSRRYKSFEIESFLHRMGTVHRACVGSSLKMCLLAEGCVDVYPRYGESCEWDIAAGDCIVTQAGGGVFDHDLQPMRYNCRETLVNPPFIAVGDTQQNWRGYLNSPIETT